MELRTKNQKEIHELQGYFWKENARDGKSVTIIGLNDEMGYHVQKNLISYYREAFAHEKLSLQTYDLFSLLFNKTYHVSSFLKHNIHLDEIYKMQIYGTESEVSHVLRMDGKVFPKISEFVSREALIEGPPKSSTALGLCDVLYRAKNPIVLYATGTNDIMYHLHVNPYSMKSVCKDKKAYQYMVSKRNELTITKIMCAHHKNIRSILSINPRSDIYVVGTSMLSVFGTRDLNPQFQAFINTYNAYLKEMCTLYNITYIDKESLETDKSFKPPYHYVASLPMYSLAEAVLKEMYQNKKEGKVASVQRDSFSLYNDGVYGILEDLRTMRDCAQREKLESDISYERKVWASKEEEHDREVKVFEKVRRNDI